MSARAPEPPSLAAPPRIVFDTSVLVAGLRSRDGASFELLRRVGSDAFELAVSVPLVLEYEAVLKREGLVFGLESTEVDAFVDFLCTAGVRQPIFFLWRPTLRDPGDEHVLEAAVAAGCRYLVTHNLRDFAGAERFGVEAIAPGAFLRLVRHREARESGPESSAPAGPEEGER